MRSRILQKFPDRCFDISWCNCGQWGAVAAEELSQCLQDIKQRDHTLVNDQCFGRLEELITRRGLE